MEFSGRKAIYDAVISGFTFYLPLDIYPFFSFTLKLRVNSMLDRVNFTELKRKRLNSPENLPKNPDFEEIWQKVALFFENPKKS